MHAVIVEIRFSNFQHAAPETEFRDLRSRGNVFATMDKTRKLVLLINGPKPSLWDWIQTMMATNLTKCWKNSPICLTFKQLIEADAMWTYLHPFLEEAKTARSVRRMARVGLWRAIHLERLVVLAGSGVTKAYGQEDWDSAFLRYIALSLEKHDKAKGETRGPQRTTPALDGLRQQILSLLNVSNPTQPNVQIVAEIRDKLKDKKTNNYGNDTLRVAVDLADELLSEMGRDRNGQLWRDRAREAFSQEFRKDRTRDDRKPPQVIPAMLDQIRVRRVLTTNYDLELERWLVESHNLRSPTRELRHDLEKLVDLWEPRMIGLTTDDRFEDAKQLLAEMADVLDGANANDRNTTNSKLMKELCDLVDVKRASLDQRRGDAGALPRRIVHGSPLGKAIISNSMDASNVGDLLNFGAYAQAHDTQIFHLHGRADKPDDMVVTQNDYRRIYASDPASEQAFQNAQEVLFAGNDVLMLGFGAGEADIMQPFRRFVQRGRDGGQVPRRTFALIGTNTSHDFKRKNEEMAVRLALDYEIYTLHYGGPLYRETINALKSLKKAPDCKALYALRIVSGKVRQIAPTRLRQKIEQLVTDDEITSLALAGPERETLANETEDRVRARALQNELIDLGRLSRDWWDAWRHAPRERRARYHIADKSVAARTNYLQVRHCSDRAWTQDLASSSQSGGSGHWQDWSPLRQACQYEHIERLNLESWRQYKRRRRARVLRLAFPRGTGTSVFVDLMHRAEVQERLFDRSSGAYRGAFIAHLSFSMEFTSVLKALSCFVGYHCAVLIREQIHAPGSVRPELKKSFLRRGQKWRKLLTDCIEATTDDALAGAEARVFPSLLFALGNIRALPELTSQDPMHTLVAEAKSWTTAQAMRHHFGLITDPTEKNWQLDTLADLLVIAEWEDDPFLIGRAKGEPAERPRSHRLDILRNVLALYRALSPKRRLFLCFSGLNRIADTDGDLFNPAHRAFFRLLTGTDEGSLVRPAASAASRTGTLADLPFQSDDLPLDILLIAGQPDSPICFLSEDVTSEKDKFTTGQRQLFSTRSKTGRWLRKWHRMDPLRWDERLQLIGFKSDTVDAEMTRAESLEDQYRADPTGEDVGDFFGSDLAAAIFLNWADASTNAAKQRRLGEFHGGQQIHDLLWHNNALSLWVITAWTRQEIETDWTRSKMPDAWKQRNVEKNLVASSPVPRGFHSFLRNLDAAAAKRGYAGVLDYVLDGYARADDTHNAKLEEQHWETDSHLNHLILQHLVLFALPVEPYVLMGCPMIVDYLSKRYTKVIDTEDQGTPQVVDWIRRYWILDRMAKSLDLLVDRGLVIRVRPARDSDLVKPDDTSPGTDAEKTADFLHYRFALHTLLRHHLAERIELAVHDGADLNHHRMSIYCDQPSDLPSPGVAHFNLIRSIVTQQVRLCREGLWCGYQHSREKQYVSEMIKGWDPEIEGNRNPKDFSSFANAGKAVALRLFAPSEDDIAAALPPTLGLKARQVANPEGLAGGLLQLHAIPQRLRATLSLVQGSFSIGALSRLTPNGSDLAGDRPYDAYRGWLRGLINAGSGLDRIRQEFEQVIKGRYLEKTSAENYEVSNWLSAAHRNAQTAVQNADGASKSDADWVSEGHLNDLKAAVRNESNVLDQAKLLGLAHRQTSHQTSLRQPFYRDEIAWLYNERGLASLTQGMLFDAVPLFEQAAFLISHRSTPEGDNHAYHAAERRIALNRAIAEIERGEIAQARLRLHDLQVSSAHIQGSTPSEIELYAQLYLGLCDHLSGAHRKALETYKQVIAVFVERNRLRAVAIGNRFLADLLRSMQKNNEALEEARYAMRAASRAEQRDVEHICMITEAHTLLELGRQEDCGPSIERVQTYAQSMGLYGVQVDAYICESRLLQARGDHSLAGTTASHAIAIAVRHGQRLRKLRAMVCYAETRLQRGSVEYAGRLLTEAVTEAERCGYLTLAAAAIDAGAAKGLRVKARD